MGNAGHELFTAAGRFRPLITRETMADGELAGLHHFGVLTASQPPFPPGVKAARVA